jgi:hypothetical protein
MIAGAEAQSEIFGGAPWVDLLAFAYELELCSDAGVAC